jgi:hypothetical protein
MRFRNISSKSGARFLSVLTIAWTCLVTGTMVLGTDIADRTTDQVGQSVLAALDAAPAAGQAPIVAQAVPTGVQVVAGSLAWAGRPWSANASSVAADAGADGDGRQSAWQVQAQ